jgi:hypothetical protein
LLVAVGIAFTDSRSRRLAATRIRLASRGMRPVVPEHAARTLVALCGMATMGFAVLELSRPPDLVAALDGYFGGSRTWIIWSGIMSIAVASVGAISYAAWRATQLPD